MELLSLFGDKQSSLDEEEDAHAMIASSVAYESTAMKLEKAIEILENDVTLQLCAQNGSGSRAVKQYTDAAAHGLFAAPGALLADGERIKAHGKVPSELLQLADQFDSLGTTLFRDRPSTQREVRSDLGWNYVFFEGRDAVRAFDQLDHEQRCALVQQIASPPLLGDPRNYSFETKHTVPIFGSLLKPHQRQVTDTDQPQTTRGLGDRITSSDQPQATRSRVTPSGQPQTTRSLGIGSAAGQSQTSRSFGDRFSTAGQSQTTATLIDRVTPASGSSGLRTLQGRHPHEKGKSRATTTGRYGDSVGGGKVAQGEGTLLSRLSGSISTDNYGHNETGSKRANEGSQGQGSRKRPKKRI